MWLFTTLLCMAAAGLVSMIGTTVFLSFDSATSLPFGSIAGVFGLVLLAGAVAFRGCVWLFYGRHKHRRVNKRRPE